MRNYLFILFSFFCCSGFSQTNWKLAVQTWTFHKYSFLETVEKADSLGIHHLEVYPGQPVGGAIPGTFSYTLDRDARDKLKQFLTWKKIKVMALGVIDKYYYNKDNLERFFEFVRYMNIPFITAEPEWEDLDTFNRLAAQYGIKVALHCHPKPSSHYWHPESTLKAMKGRSHIGAWPDIGHWARNGVALLPALQQLKGKIWGMHFKDVKAFDQLQAADTLFGRGVCQLPAVLQELKKQGFSGVMSLEYEANEENNMADMRANLRYYESERKKLNYPTRIK